MIRFIGKAVLLLLVLGVVGVWVLSMKRPPSSADTIEWGFTFSHIFAQHLELDWRSTYLAALDELQPAYVRIPVYWDNVEAHEEQFYFEDLDFLINEAGKRDVKTIVAMGKRVPRWPECHIPQWAQGLSQEEQVDELKDVIREVIERYKKEDHIISWQIENEPFLPYFGICPPFSDQALDEEIDLARFLDSERPITVTDSGVLSVWLPAAKRADIFGTTMYRDVWSRIFSPYVGYITYPFPPQFFWLKANLVHLLYGADKQIINVELQGEPWAPDSLKNLSREEQEETMTIEKFRANIEYAREVGFSPVLLWGVEWWYVQKEQKGDAAYWEEAQKIFRE